MAIYAFQIPVSPTNNENVNPWCESVHEYLVPCGSSRCLCECIILSVCHTKSNKLYINKTRLN